MTLEGTLVVVEMATILMGQAVKVTKGNDIGIGGEGEGEKRSNL
jgi:hypothetical protein